MAMERPDQTLDASGLVHEGWLRLEKTAPERWRDRKQFYGAATEAMRRILVEAARRRIAEKRGGGKRDITLDENEISSQIPDERLLGIHEVLDQLEDEDEMNARIVKLRFFAGLNYDEIAALLEVNEKTIRRHWAVAKLWLFRALREDGEKKE
jgi:RNA polymerase sigma factor (TIGR02999 family)